jgi:hypothetical protein
MENLEKVEKEIREKLPRTREVSRLGMKMEPYICLNDVLEWLGIEYMVNGKGALCKWSDDEFRYIPQDNWNLHEQYLKDQESSIINYLASLI